jgi:hypothetical protein
MIGISGFSQSETGLDKDGVKKAYLYLLKNTWIFDSLRLNLKDPTFAIAVVFPELIRYSVLKDQFELGGLYSLYVHYGKAYADFSVGRFQMKPSFAEQIEKDAQKFKVGISLVYPFSNPEQIRLERVKRLNNPFWQIKYLTAFIKIMEVKYSRKVWKNTPEKLRFYSTAYNCGYTLSEKELKKRMGMKSFYTGIVRRGKCFCYPEISCSYYSGHMF